ncbi:growth arrest and DNA damage-inducible proteins-interacting protein 1 [Bombina bombina]|uniref:growth arrest and DNA damage-inducible proteins-interacting protein 1 n=1 Tax=Bombina bombina TaxID=8345 RepID=UPI00235ADEEF|nr:growth arrest and DNA damage-inducible proteins-interacting protein 1 [Bombina bombina]
MAAAMRRCWTQLTLLWPAASYHARPRIWGLGGIYKPDPEDPRTKEWQKGPAYEAKLYGRFGSPSGVKPESLWPSQERLREIEEEEKEWCPTLREMLDKVEAEERELQRAKEARERLIAANMAKMPKMVADWRREKKELRQKLREEKDRRERLLARAREKFGLNVDHRSPKFQELVKEMEKEEKKKQKALKKKLKEESLAAVPATPSPQSVSTTKAETP